MTTHCIAEVVRQKIATSITEVARQTTSLLIPLVVRLKTMHHATATTTTTTLATADASPLATALATTLAITIALTLALALALATALTLATATATAFATTPTHHSAATAAVATAAITP